MRSKATRLTGVAWFTLALGAAFLPLGCAAEEPFTGVHSTPAPRDPRWLPEQVVAQLTACAEKLPAALPGERTEHLVGFDVQAGRKGEIDRVTLKRSTLGSHGVEACMGSALSEMRLPIEDRVPLLVAEGGKHALSPEARGLLGGGPLLGSIALLPAVLTIARITIVVAVVLYVSYEVVQAIEAYARSTTTTVAAAAPSATTTATAAAGAITTATAAKDAKAASKRRRKPNQTCENEELDELEAKKTELCKEKYAANCTGNKENSAVRERLNNIPCSNILRSLRQRPPCLEQRKLIQARCYGGIPDPGHKQAIDDLERGLKACEELQVINCAKGHPMSEL